MSWWNYCGALLVIYIARKVFEFRTNARKMAYIPGLRSIFSPMSPFGALIPTFSLNPGLGWQWQWRNQVYSKYGVETISVLPYLIGTPSLYTRSLDVARQVVSVKSQFEKPEQFSSSVLLWGRNLLAENGAEWSRHRRIMGPAFNPGVYAQVWDETVNVYQEMMQAEGWTERSDLTLHAINDITTKVALIIISRCGFGRPLSWSNMSDDPSAMPFSEALAIVSASSIARLVIPRWMYSLPIKSLRDIETAHTTVAEFMQGLIKTRREELAAGQNDSERKDVFRLMIRASEGEGTLRMSDDELTGNTFLMLFAGHDTTAKALDAAIGFLALYEDIQEEVYQEVCEVMSADGKLHFNDCSRLKKVQGCFLEGARLFPAAYVMARETTDTVILNTEEDGHGGQIILEPGTQVIVDVVGLHYNAKYFPEPEEFRPSRWYDAAESDMTMFSFGARVCIGRRFALTEGVAFLSQLLRDWKVQIVLNPGETRPQWRQRVMKGVAGMTLGVGEVPVRLTRR
ncbi:cytochrome P450 [Mycena epipterygia]|nr:cytochrome P450 [Mycena epipterygia]